MLRDSVKSTAWISIVFPLAAALTASVTDPKYVLPILTGWFAQVPPVIRLVFVTVEEPFGFVALSVTVYVPGFRYV